MFSFRHAQADPPGTHSNSQPLGLLPPLLVRVKLSPPLPVDLLVDLLPPLPVGLLPPLTAATTRSTAATTGVGPLPPVVETSVDLSSPLPVHILHITEGPFAATENRRQRRRAGHILLRCDVHLMSCGLADVGSMVGIDATFENISADAVGGSAGGVGCGCGCGYNCTTRGSAAALCLAGGSAARR